MVDTWSLINIAAVSSWQTCLIGAPFGGTLTWCIIVVTANDSGAYPWAPLHAAVVGFPITIVCDLVLLVPALLIISFNMIGSSSLYGR